MRLEPIPHIRRTIDELVEVFQMLVSSNLTGDESLSFRARLYYGPLAHLHLYLHEKTELQENLKQISELILTRVETLRKDVRKGELSKNRYAHRALEVIESPYGSKSLIDYTLDSIAYLDNERENLGRMMSLAEKMSHIALRDVIERDNRYGFNVLYPALQNATTALQNELHESLASTKLTKSEHEAIIAKGEESLNAWLNLGSVEGGEELAESLAELLKRERDLT